MKVRSFFKSYKVMNLAPNGKGRVGRIGKNFCVLVRLIKRNIINILVLRPFQLKREQETNSGDKHYTKTTHCLINFFLYSL